MVFYQSNRKLTNTSVILHGYGELSKAMEESMLPWFLALQKLQHYQRPNNLSKRVLRQKRVLGIDIGQPWLVVCSPKSSRWNSNCSLVILKGRVHPNMSWTKSIPASMANRTGKSPQGLNHTQRTAGNWVKLSVAETTQPAWYKEAKEFTEDEDHEGKMGVMKLSSSQEFPMNMKL